VISIQNTKGNATGHLRLGRLPKTQPWSDVFQVLESESLDGTRLARTTAEAAHGELWAIGHDPAVNYSLLVLLMDRNCRLDARVR